MARRDSGGSRGPEFATTRLLEPVVEGTVLVPAYFRKKTVPRPFDSAHWYASRPSSGLH